MLRFLFVLLAACAVCNAKGLKARAVLKGDEVNGEVVFTQEETDGEVLINGVVRGHAPGDYGFHVLEGGDISGGCDSAGDHFNPYMKDHGHPHDEHRHVGDLGNIEFDSRGVARVHLHDHLISLSGETSVVGRTLVVTSGKDDHGQGDHPHSKINGNSGHGVSCGVITLV